jgi:Ion channel
MPQAERRAGRYGLLLLATVASVAVQGVAEPGGVQQVVVTALAGGTLVLAFHAGDLAPRFTKAVIAFAVAALIVAVVRATAGGIGEGAARTVNAALVALGPPAVAIGLLRELRATQEVRLQAVAGVLCLYVLVGMTFGFVYGAIDNLGGDPFFANGEAATVSHCLYFSLTTLATVGYGDFVARSDLGHTLAVSEALIGQIYLVTVVSLIVSNLRRPAPRDRSQT